MKIKITIALLLVVLGSTSFLSDAPPKLHYLKLTVPKDWPKPPKDIFATNPLTEEGFELGKKLFYDGRLSKDGNVPCASCHQQFASFSTYDHDFSHGFNNSFTRRNAPPIFNLAWMKELHWDGAINHIEVQPLAPLTAANEMAESIENVLKKLNADTAYKRMFKAAFGDATINSQHMLKALAQFTGSIISCNSKYDQVKKGTASFSMSEEQGYKIFKAKCNACHTEPLFTDNAFRNNGLDINLQLADKGRMGISNDPADSLKFKVSSLRNLYLTAPYMHDGRMNTLQEVLQHYRNGINDTQPTLDSLLKSRIVISKKEEVDLLAFLYTLTDTEMVKNKRFAATATYKTHEGPH